MADAKIVLKRAGVHELLNGPDMERAMLKRAEQAAAVARASAPVESGEYRDGIHAEVVHTDRAVGRVYADAPHSLVVEARTRNLGRSLDAAAGD